MSPRDEALVDALAAQLPQTQCRRCGHDGCRPYAEALVTAGASNALCPPGGEVTRQALARILGRDAPVAPLPDEPARVARVREADCIGCRRCVDVCPVDAIIGAAGRMHTVFDAWCNGCALCAPVCPTDCIELLPVTTSPTAAQNLARHQRRAARAQGVRHAPREHALVPLEQDPAALAAAVQAAVARRRGRAQ